MKWRKELNMKRILCLSLLFFAWIGTAIAQESGEIDPPVPEPMCGEEPEDKVVSYEKVFSEWPDGSVKSKTIKFVDKSSVFLQYHQNGNMKLKSHYDSRNKQDGTEKRWHENGQLFVCAVYSHGKKQGTWIYYDEEGVPRSSFTYEDDKEVEHLTYSPKFGWQRFK